MANMSYCRFQNTYRDLMDCYYNINNDLSESEHRYRERLIEVCKNILDEYDPGSLDDIEEEIENKQ